MNTSTIETSPRAREVAVSPTELTVYLRDGRTVSVPLSWFPRLLKATPQERSNFELIGNGEGIHWPAVDEDLSVAGILRGVRAPGKQGLSSRTGVLKSPRVATSEALLKKLSAREYQVFSLMIHGI